MKTIILYQCEICHNRDEDITKILLCESKGIPDPNKIPLGLMYEYHHHGFVGIFAVSNVHKSSINPHYLTTTAWSARVPGLPQMSSKDDVCSGIDFISTTEEGLKEFAKEHHVTREKLNSKEFLRMKEFLIENKITPSYYDENGHLHYFKL